MARLHPESRLGGSEQGMSTEVSGQLRPLDGPSPINSRRARTIIVTLVLTPLIPYTAYFWVAPEGLSAAALGFLPGLFSVGLLLALGFSRDDCYLRFVRLSRAGLWTLVAVTPLLAVILPSGDWVGWGAGRVITGALGGIQQELYFRGAVLPALLWALAGRQRAALILVAMLSVIWHLRMYSQAPLLAWLPITLVLFLGHLTWTWQVRRDRTLIWAAAHHSLLLAIMSLFGLA